MADMNQMQTDGDEAKGHHGDEYEEIREQDRYLPIANIARIMKNTLPENAKIAKDSKETVQECVSEFISFITSEASDKCLQEKRKTINGDDLLWAMSTLGFDKYVEVSFFRVVVRCLLFVGTSLVSLSICIGTLTTHHFSRFSYLLSSLHFPPSLPTLIPTKPLKIYLAKYRESVRTSGNKKEQRLE
eukprot:scaffold130_cov151-Amphora_coffeaeformis.AAC.1